MSLPAPELLVTPSLKLVRKLSTGTMGSVWVAQHLTLGTTFAIKFISQGLIEADPTTLVRFSTEARAAASIKSPHVVRTTDYGVTDEGEPYIVMELLEGETLLDRLSRDGPMDPVVVAATMTQVCRGLQSAHDLGILHRDVKPENIFLCSDAEWPLVKLIDFGLAKLTRGDTSLMPTAAGTQVGTPAFMSPEQILADGAVDHRSDLWGTAVVAYHALTGRHPFRGRNIAEYRESMMQQDFIPASTHRPGLPVAVDAWFERALQVEPANRFNSATELADELVEALGARAELPNYLTRRGLFPSLSGSSPGASQPDLLAVADIASAPTAVTSEDLLDAKAPEMVASGVKVVAELTGPSPSTQALQRQLRQRTTFFAVLCLVLAGVAIALALR